MNQTIDPKLTLSVISKFITEQNPEIRRQVINEQRIYLSNLIFNFHGKVVAYGPFKGLKLADNPRWGVADKGTMTLGLYEQEVLHDLVDSARNYSIFIDLGAADGYYGIGSLTSGLFKKTYCFEASEEGQSIIKETACNNGISQEKLSINGYADKDFFKKIPSSDLKESILFADIEGGEFDLFDENTFKVFSNSIIYIELHDWFFPDPASKISKLKMDSEKTHTWNEIHTSFRNPFEFPELHTLSDDDRWLLCSEGRAQLMRWAKLIPIAKL